MASAPDDLPLDIRDVLARIDKAPAETGKLNAETRKFTSDVTLAKPQLFFQGMLAAAALIAAGAALVKIFA